MAMETYQHNVQYYETDQMGITHHSNYIRFMEEARIDFFKKLGYDYREFEKRGIVSPVIGLNNIKYKKPSTFGDKLDIDVCAKTYNTIILTLHYVMKKDGVVIFEGDSEHCFLSKEGKMLKLGDNNLGDLHRLLKSLVPPSDE